MIHFISKSVSRMTAYEAPCKDANMNKIWSLTLQTLTV